MAIVTVFWQMLNFRLRMLCFQVAEFMFFTAGQFFRSHDQEVIFYPIKNVTFAMVFTNQFKTMTQTQTQVKRHKTTTQTQTQVKGIRKRRNMCSWRVTIRIYVTLCQISVL